MFNIVKVFYIYTPHPPFFLFSIGHIILDMCVDKNRYKNSCVPHIAVKPKVVKRSPSEVS